VTNPAAETKSIGLPADAQLSWFLQRHLDSFIVTGQLAAFYFIVTQNSRPSTGILQKHMPTPTQTATPHTTGPLCLSLILSVILIDLNLSFSYI
jgi:hypothetical protein